MLGKRPHQIQRTTSMSQLRAPPSARPRPPLPQERAMPLSQHKASTAPLATVDAVHPQPHQDITTLAVEGIPPNVSHPHDRMSPAAIVHSHTIPDNSKASSSLQPVPPIMHADASPASSHGHTVHGHSGASPLPAARVASLTRMPPPPLLTAGHAVPKSFMDACYLCKKPLGHGRDIFMYRGDAAFCSEDCRLRQIAHDERQHNCPVSASGGSKNAIIVSTS